MSLSGTILPNLFLNFCKKKNFTYNSDIFSINFILNMNFHERYSFEKPNFYYYGEFSGIPGENFALPDIPRSPGNKYIRGMPTTRIY